MNKEQLNKFSIRPATIRDAENLSALSFHTWLDTYAKDGVRSSYSRHLQSSLSPANFVEMAENSQYSIWLAEIELSVIGFIVLKRQSPCPADSCCTTEITTLYVFKRFANCGVGSQLLEFAINECRSAFQNSMWLSTNYENEVAIKFYKKSEFTIVGTLMFQLEDGEHPNHIFMNTF